MHSSVSKPTPPIKKFPATSDGREDLCISYLRLYSTTVNLRLTIRSAPNQRLLGNCRTDVSGVRVASSLDDGDHRASGSGGWSPELCPIVGRGALCVFKQKPTVLDWLLCICRGPSHRPCGWAFWAVDVQQDDLLKNSAELVICAEVRLSWGCVTVP